MHAVPLTEPLAHATGASTDRGGRIEVNPDLTVPGHPEISVIGDVAALKGPGGKPLPGLATVAIQQARHVAKAIREGQPGRLHAVPLLRQGRAGRRRPGQGRLRDQGARAVRPAAFFTYLGVHLYYLGGAPGRRLEVLIRLDRRPLRRAPERADRGRARERRAGAPPAEATPVGADLFPLAADLDAARSQMAFTLGFHIILARLGVAFPAIILIANYRGCAAATPTRSSWRSGGRRWRP